MFKQHSAKNKKVNQRFFLLIHPQIEELFIKKFGCWQFCLSINNCDRNLEISHIKGSLQEVLGCIFITGANSYCFHSFFVIFTKIIKFKEKLFLILNSVLNWMARLLFNNGVIKLFYNFNHVFQTIYPDPLSLSLSPCMCHTQNVNMGLCLSVCVVNAI